MTLSIIALHPKYFFSLDVIDIRIKK